MSAREPLEVEVVTHIAGSMQHCAHCQVFIDGVGVGDKVHQENIQSYPPEFIEDWQRVSGWILDLAAAHPGQLTIRVTDAQSLRGMWKAISQGVRRYPTFIVAGQEKYHGWDPARLEELLSRHL